MNVATVDDRIVELNEMFVIILERTPDMESRIMLNPVAGHVEIIVNSYMSMSVVNDMYWLLHGPECHTGYIGTVEVSKQ